MKRWKDTLIHTPHDPAPRTTYHTIHFLRVEFFQTIACVVTSEIVFCSFYHSLHDRLYFMVPLCNEKGRRKGGLGRPQYWTNTLYYKLHYTLYTIYNILQLGIHARTSVFSLPCSCWEEFQGPLLAQYLMFKKGFVSILVICYASDIV